MEVLQNLIDNAVRFTSDSKEPFIEIGQRHDGNQRVIFVRDNGIGIEPQYLKRIFNLFEQLNPQAGGTGVGLAISKRIVEVHGGSIWAESDGLGKGATFCFTLPEVESLD
jgi:signal transduction histidine kinase